jgi:hypothetical protein
MKANKGAYWTLPEVISWIRTRSEKQLPVSEISAMTIEFARTIDELLESCRAGRIHAVGRYCIWPDQSLKYSIDPQVQMRWAQAVSNQGHPSDFVESIPSTQWFGLELEPLDNARSKYSDRRIWTTVRFSQADVIREWPPANFRRRGRKPDRLEKAKNAMRADIKEKRLTSAELKGMPGKQLSDRYGVSRTTASAARKVVLDEIEPAGN